MVFELAWALQEAVRFFAVAEPKDVPFLLQPYAPKKTSWRHDWPAPLLFVAVGQAVQSSRFLWRPQYRIRASREFKQIQDHFKGLHQYLSSLSAFTVAFTSSSIFFIITNFGVWLMGGYPKSLEGILLCYTMALPFFLNSIAGDFFFSYLLKWSFRYSEKKILLGSSIG